MSKSKKISKNGGFLKKIATTFAVGSSLASGSALGKMITKDTYEKITSNEDIVDETEYLEESVEIEDSLLSKVFTFLTED